MLLSVHTIWGSASAPTAEHQRRRPRTAGDRAGRDNRQFNGALIERFRHFSDLLPHLLALIPAENPHAAPLDTRPAFGGVADDTCAAAPSLSNSTTATLTFQQPEQSAPYTCVPHSDNHYR